jgi:hypothetical protein
MGLRSNAWQIAHPWFRYALLYAAGNTTEIGMALRALQHVLSVQHRYACMSYVVQGTTTPQHHVLLLVLHHCITTTAVSDINSLLYSGCCRCRGELSRGKEAALSRALETVEVQLSPTSPAGLQRRLDALAAACRLRASSGTLGMGPNGQNGAKLDEASLGQLFAVLKEHVEGLKQLQEVLRR